MKISKGEKIYIVRECKNHWSISEESATFSICFKVDKEVCKTEAEIIEYININNMF